MGCKISLHQTTDAEREIGKEVRKSADALGEEAYIKRILEAKKLTEDEAMALEARKDKLTSDELANLEAYRQEDFYLELLSEDLIREDKRGRLRSAVDRMETVRTPFKKLRERDERELTETDIHPQQCVAREAVGRLSRELLRLLKFDPDTMEPTDHRWDVEELKESGLVQYVLDHALDIETFLGLKIAANFEQRPTRFVSDFLRTLGLRIRGEQVRIDGVRRRFYRIDEESRKKLRKIIAPRIILKDPINDGQWFERSGHLYRYRPFRKPEQAAA